MLNSIYEIIILLLLGGLGGLLAGLLGIGGGVIYVLVFNHYLQKIGVPDSIIVPSIIANSMFAILFAGISGSYKQWKNKNLFPSEMVIAGLAAAISSILFSYIISKGTWYTKENFSIFFIILLALIAFRIFTQRKQLEQENSQNPSMLSLSITGLISGTIAAFSGIGGGVIIVPILTDRLKLPIKKATSISLGVISIMALCTSVYNILTSIKTNGEATLIVSSLALPIAIGSLIGSPVGVQIASKLKPIQIRIVLFIFLISVIFKLIYNLY
jgi:uncharacterized membrane protein YfcA